MCILACERTPVVETTERACLDQVTRCTVTLDQYREWLLACEVEQVVVAHEASGEWAWDLKIEVRTARICRGVLDRVVHQERMTDLAYVPIVQGVVRRDRVVIDRVVVRPVAGCQGRERARYHIARALQIPDHLV